MTVPLNPTGPIEPGSAPNARRIASGVENATGAFTCASLPDLTRFN